MDKKIKIKKYNDFYFYKALNVFSEQFLEKLEKSTVHWLETTRKSFSIMTETVGKEAYPPEASSRLLDIPAYKNDPISIKYYNELKLHIAKYCEITGLNLSKVSFHSSWITRVADIETEEYSKEVLRGKRERYSTFGNMHSHQNNPIGIIYYLKNPDPKYGTLIKLSHNEMFNNNGEENSLLIFNPKLYHSPIYPPTEELEKSARISIVTDCHFV